MRRKLVIKATIVVFVGLALALTPVSGKAAEWPKKKVEYRIISGPEGSFGYMAATVLSKILTDNIKNFAVYPEAGGTIKAFRQMAKGEMMMSYGNTVSIEQAYRGTGPFEKQPLKGLKPQFGAHMLPFTFFMVAKKTSNLYKMDDLVGKSITITTPAYGIFTPAYEVMRVLGLWDKVKPKDVSFADYAGAIAGDIVDSCMIFILADATTAGAIRNVEARIDMRPLTFTDDQKKKINGLPGLGFREAKNVFPEIKAETIGGWGYYYGWHFSPKANDKLVYEIVKTCYAKRAELAKASIGFRPWNTDPKGLLKAAFSVSPKIPIHPGALKFYKEIGVK